MTIRNYFSSIKDRTINAIKVLYYIVTFPIWLPYGMWLLYQILFCNYYGKLIDSVVDEAKAKWGVKK